MVKWNIVRSEEFFRAAKWYEKKKKNAFIAVMANLEKYILALNMQKSSNRIEAGFIHPEPKGIIALDQTGKKQKGKLPETRLYLYLEKESQIVYLLTIGDKKSQSKDINLCVKMIKKLDEIKGV